MNFEQWWAEYGVKFNSEYPKEISRLAWNECKKETLKILKDKNNEDLYDTDGGVATTLSIGVINEIEKL